MAASCVQCTPGVVLVSVHVIDDDKATDNLDYDAVVTLAVSECYCCLVQNTDTYAVDQVPFA